MSFLIICGVTCGFVMVAARFIKAVPWLWYGVALALDFVYAYGIVYSLPPEVLRVLSVVMQRGMLATSLFVIVMYCGVFSERSFVHRTVAPIRAELSLIACILILAHCLNYLSSYLGVLGTNVAAINPNQLASLIAALVLCILLLVLGVTSVKVLKRRMNASVWKNIQRSSYVFFGLIYVHELLVLYPAALKGAGDALITCIVGGIVFGSYYVLRLVRYLTDRRENDTGALVESQRGREIGA